MKINNTFRDLIVYTILIIYISLIHDGFMLHCVYNDFVNLNPFWICNWPEAIRDTVLAIIFGFMITETILSYEKIFKCNKNKDFIAGIFLFVALITLISTICIEITQRYLHIGFCDMNTVLLCVIGSAIGFGIKTYFYVKGDK